MYPDLKGKVAIVTGSSRGIGRAIAVRLAREGCKVVINYSKDFQGAEETQRIAGEKSSIIVKADVSRVEECRKLVDETMKKFGKIDIMVNNAGVFNRKASVEITEDDWNHVIGTNLKPAFFLSVYAAKHMKGGSIINISSSRARKKRAGIEPYAASKAGVESITKTFAIELAEKKIRVNAVSPGPVKTDPHHAATGIVQQVPMKRLGEPEEIANVVAFLASEDASFITGAVIGVDGGFIC